MTCLSCGKPVSSECERQGIPFCSIDCNNAHWKRTEEARRTPKLREDQKIEALDPGFWDGFTPWI